MKYLLTFSFLMFLSYSGISQLQSFKEVESPVQLKNKISVQMNSITGYTLTYDRQLFQKERFSLIGQVGVGGYPYIVSSLERKRAIQSIHIPLSLQAKYTLGAHSLKVGVGTMYTRILPNYGAYKYLTKKGFFETYFTAGYEFAPVKKNWSIGTGLQYNLKPTRPGLYFSAGYKF